MAVRMGFLYRPDGAGASYIHGRGLLFCESFSAVTGAAPPPDAAIIPIDAPPDAPVALGARGERCPCAEGLSCTALPGGYCAAASCADCDGACVDTTRFGELCAARCTKDSDCRADEGYVCDPRGTRVSFRTRP